MNRLFTDCYRGLGNPPRHDLEFRQMYVLYDIYMCLDLGDWLMMVWALQVMLVKRNASKRSAGLHAFTEMWNMLIWFGSTPQPVTVTTRIMSFLIGNLQKPSFATGILGGGYFNFYDVV